MASKLFEEKLDSPISPLIDVVLNGFAAIFVILMIYILAVRPSEEIFLLKNIQPNPAFSLVEYSFTVPAVGGIGNRFFNFEGELPEGLQFHKASGTFYGVPKIPTGKDSMSYRLRVKVKDSSGGDSTDITLKLYNMNLLNEVKLYSKVKTIQRGRVGVPFQGFIPSIGIDKKVKWSISPKHIGRLSIEPGGIITGDVQMPYSGPISINVSQGNGFFIYQNDTISWDGKRSFAQYPIEILPPVQSSISLPIGRVGEKYEGVVKTGELLSNETIEWDFDIPGIKETFEKRVIEGIPNLPGVYDVSYKVKNDTFLLDEGNGQVTILPLSSNHSPETGKNIFFAEYGKEFEFHIPYRGFEEPVQIELINSQSQEFVIENWLVKGKFDKLGFYEYPIKIFDKKGNKANGNLSFFIFSSRNIKPLAINIPQKITIPTNKPFELILKASGGSESFEWKFQFKGQNFTNSKIQFLPSGKIKGRADDPFRKELLVFLTDQYTRKEIQKEIIFEAVNSNFSRTPTLKEDDLSQSRKDINTTNDPIKNILKKKSDELDQAQKELKATEDLLSDILKNKSEELRKSQSELSKANQLIFQLQSKLDSLEKKE